MNSILKELVLNTHSHYIYYRNVVEILEKQKILNHLNISNNDIFKISSTNMKPTLEDYNKFIINQILEKNEGNKLKTSEELGISRTTLWRILNSNEYYGILILASLKNHDCCVSVQFSCSVVSNSL